MKSKAVRKTFAILMALVLTIGIMGTITLATPQNGWAWDPIHNGFAFYRNGTRVGRGQVRAGETVYFAANLFAGADFVFNNDGILVTELVSYGGAWHYFDPNTGSRVAYGFVSWWYDGGFKFLDADGTKRTGGVETVNWEYPIGSGNTFSGTYLFGDDGYLIIDFDFDLMGGTSVHSVWGQWHQVVTQFYNTTQNGITGWVMTANYGPIYLRGDGTHAMPNPERPAYIMIGERRISTSLTSLDLAFRGLTDADIIPLRHMTNLMWLDLRGNNITDITPLSGLTSLTRLRLGSNQISDLTPMSTLTNIYDLDLGGNHINDLDPLAHLTRLRFVDLKGNSIYISDWSPLAHVARVEGRPQPKYVTIGGEQFRVDMMGLSLQDRDLTNADIIPLQYMTSLTILILSDNNQISDLTPLAGLTNLTGLYISGANVSDLTPLSDLINLTGLHLSNNQIQDLSPISSLTNLTSLSLAHNPIDTVAPLSGLTNLIWLTVGYVGDLTLLQNLTSLGSLTLEGDQIRDLAPISGIIQNVISLTLRNTQVSDLAPLSNMVNLIELNVETWNIDDPLTPVSDLTPLSGLANLQVLRVPNAQVSDITPLSGLRNLQFVDLRSNFISDWSPIAHVRIVWRDW